MIPQRLNKQAIEYVKEGIDPYSFYRGQYVEVQTPIGRYIGVYGGLTEQWQIVLLRYISHSINFQEDNLLIEFKNNLPVMIQYSPQNSGAIIPRSDSEIEKLLSKYNKTGKIPEDYSI